MAEEATKRRGGGVRVIRVVLVLVIVACLGVLGFIGGQYLGARVSYDNLSDKVVQYNDNVNELAAMTIDWDALRAECPDVIAWIRVPGTIIDYPVVQGPDNEYYLHRSYDGTTSWLSSGGTIFLDYQNASDFSDQNNVLYGHHMNDGSMFAELASWVNQDAFDANRTIYVLTPTMNYRLTTFAVVATDGSDAIVQTTFPTAEAFSQYVQDKVARSSVSVSQDEMNLAGLGKMFMLVTCEYSQNDGRACVCAAVSEQAAPLN